MAASIELARAMYIQIGNSSLRRISQIVGRGNCTPMRTYLWTKTLIWVNKLLVCSSHISADQDQTDLRLTTWLLHGSVVCNVAFVWTAMILLINYFINALQIREHCPPAPPQSPKQITEEPTVTPHLKKQADLYLQRCELDRDFAGGSVPFCSLHLNWLLCINDTNLVHTKCHKSLNWHIYHHHCCCHSHNFPPIPQQPNHVVNFREKAWRTLFIISPVLLGLSTQF